MRNQEALLTMEGLTSHIASLVNVPVDEFSPIENLMDYGLDSIQVLELLSAWEGLGVSLDFIELAAEPTLAGWWRLLQSKMGA